MRLQHLSATPHPDGNHIILRWHYPNPEQELWVQIRRRPDAYPTTVEDGTLVTQIIRNELGVDTVIEEFPVDAEGWGIADDRGPCNQGLQGETVYYYTFFPYLNRPGEAEFDSQNCIAAMATQPYGMAGQMYDLLPGLYHRYDANPDPTRGKDAPDQLRRFLELTGGQFDHLYSFATALLNTCNLDQLDGRLLPLLAQWIGWETDYRVGFPQQRNEIRDAPYLYQSMGVSRTLEATVKRILGWESRTKEFAHNILISNSPERLNLWWQQRQENGSEAGSEAGSGFQTRELLSLNFAYGGRPTGVQDADGIIWLFYHTRQQDRWEIWYKTYGINKANEANLEWSPSQPLGQDHRSTLEKYPTAAVQGETLWVFWNRYDQTDRRWSIHYRTYTNGNWSPVYPVQDDQNSSLPWPQAVEASRRHPIAVTDAEDKLWLFWLESSQAGQRLYYNCYTDEGQWESAPEVFPLTSDQNPPVFDHVFVLAHPTEAKLWVFWDYQVPTEKLRNQTRWQMAYRVSEDLSLTDWGEVYPIAGFETEEGTIAHDREPCAHVKEDGSIELFWSSTRGGGWSIWQSVLQNPNDVEEPIWTAPAAITTGPYSHRNPLVLDLPALADSPGSKTTALIYRSNRSVTYTSQTYRASETTDFRYSGSTTVEIDNQAKLALRDQFNDFQTYTFAVQPRSKPQTPEDWYAWYARWDTIGLYLTPTTADPRLLQQDQIRLQNVLDQFLPIQLRVEFFVQSERIDEPYDTLNEVQDQVTEIKGIFAPDTETYDGPREDKSIDTMVGWQIFKSNCLEHITVDFGTDPPITTSRTWHSALNYPATFSNVSGSPPREEDDRIIPSEPIQVLDLEPTDEELPPQSLDEPITPIDTPIDNETDAQPDSPWIKINIFQYLNKFCRWLIQRIPYFRRFGPIKFPKPVDK